MHFYLVLFTQSVKKINAADKKGAKTVSVNKA